MFLCFLALKINMLNFKLIFVPKPWLDVKMDDMSTKAMVEGVENSKLFVAILSLNEGTEKGYFVFGNILIDFIKLAYSM